MENIAVNKQNIITWINSIEGQKVLKKLDGLRKEKPFNFEAEIKRAISGEELKKRKTDFLKTLDWKK